jgi:hypothetical protein
MRMHVPLMQESTLGFVRPSDRQIQRACVVCDEELLRQPLDKEEEEIPQTEENAGYTPQVIPNAANKIDALQGKGQPLSNSIRAYFEPRFGYDLSHVRVHTGFKAAEAADSVNAKAFTQGKDVVFGAGQYSPVTSAGRRLIAHELTHVVQQSQDLESHTTDEAVLEREALLAADKISCGQDVVVRGVARRNRPQFYRVPYQGRTWEIGDINLDQESSEFVMHTLHFLTTPADRGHIIAFPQGGRRQLGYEVSHTNPSDVVRWTRLREIIDNPDTHLDISETTGRGSYKQVRNGSEQDQRNVDLLDHFGRDTLGLTFVRRSVYESIHGTSDPVVRDFNASIDNDRDQIYWIHGGTSLAHEFFGHLWLAMRGVPFGHPPTVADLQSSSSTPLTPEERGRVTRRLQVIGTLRPEHGIEDPFGQSYTGSVREFIDMTAGEEQTRRHSPTLRVGPQHLSQAMQVLRTELASHTGIRRTQEHPHGYASGDVIENFAWVAHNYATLVRRSGIREIITPMGQSQVLDQISIIYTGLNDDRQQLFRNFLCTVRGWGSSIQVIPRPECSLRTLVRHVSTQLRLPRCPSLEEIIQSP